MTVGCPGAGKTTFARDNFPKWVTLSLDDFRTALFRDKQFYHAMHRENPRMRALLNDTYEDALRAALGYGFSAILANMHVYPDTFASTMALIKRFGITPHLAVFVQPIDILLQRNSTRPFEDRVPVEFIYTSHTDMMKSDAWWRSYPHKSIIKDSPPCS